MHYALRDSWASPVAQLVKNLRAMQQQCMVTEVFFFFLIFMYSLHRTWLQHVGSPSIPRDGTCPASLAVQSLSHGTPRAVPMLKVFIHDPRVLFRPRDWSNV